MANGAAALAAAGVRLLGEGGVDPATASKMLGPLLKSVGDNVESLGLPAALTGPVRRGDAAAVGRHLEVIRSRTPELVPLYLELIRAQLPWRARSATPILPRSLPSRSLLGPPGRKRVD